MSLNLKSRSLNLLPYVTPTRRHNAYGELIWFYHPGAKRAYIGQIHNVDYCMRKMFGETTEYNDLQYAIYYIDEHKNRYLHYAWEENVIFPEQRYAEDYSN